MWKLREHSFDKGGIHIRATLTLADVRVLLSTATVCSWDDTSSIVLGRLAIIQCNGCEWGIASLTISLPMAAERDQTYV